VHEIADVWPAGLALRAALSRLGSPEEMLALTQAVLSDGLDEQVRGTERCAIAVAALETDPARSVAALARDLGITHAHLDREFARVVGLTPRVLSRILRMRRLLESIDPGRPVRWTDEAERWGWFDQAHLIRDFKRHTGVTPSRYLAAQRTYAGGDAAPGFVPDTA
jgi:AraC-like DNA-binding protein